MLVRQQGKIFTLACNILRISMSSLGFGGNTAWYNDDITIGFNDISLEMPSMLNSHINYGRRSSKWKALNINTGANIRFKSKKPISWLILSSKCWLMAIEPAASKARRKWWSMRLCEIGFEHPEISYYNFTARLDKRPPCFGLMAHIMMMIY